MRHHIEHAKIKYDWATITGWLVGDTLRSATQLWVEDSRGAQVACLTDRTLREDVAAAVWGAETMMPELEGWRDSLEKLKEDAAAATTGGAASVRGFAEPVGLMCGFRVRFPMAKGKQYILCLGDGKKTVRCKVDAAQIAQLGRLPDDFKELIKIKLGKGECPSLPASESRRREAIKRSDYVDLTDPAHQAVKFSVVVPVYNTEPEHLADMIQSIRQQTYGNWELCIADGTPGMSLLENFQAELAGQKHVELSKPWGLSQILVEYLTDPRVKYQHLSENLGISGNTNAALALADGDFVVMVDHDDVLEEDALEQVARVILAHPQADFIYSDSDLTDHDNLYHYNHLLKPRWSQEMLYSANYITHLSVVRTSLLHQIGGWKKEYDGAQDWDLFLRIGEATSEIYHIPAILYHWRAADSSTARDIGTKPYARLAQLRAVQDHLDRRGLPAKTDFVDENSTCIRVVWKPEYLAAMDMDRVLIFTADGVKLSPESAAELCAWALQPGMGVIGARVIGVDGHIASQGTTMDIVPNKPCYGMVPGTASFGGHTDWYQDHVTPDPVCWAISRQLWEQLGGLDESWGELALMDLCLRAEKAGYRSMVTPFAQVDLREVEDADKQSVLSESLSQSHWREMSNAHTKLYKSYYPRIEDRPN